MVPVVAGALLAAPGWAKGPSSATVCGSSGCAIFRGEIRVLPLYEWWNRPFSLRSAPRAAPYFRIKLVDPGVRTSILLYAPDRRAMRIWQSASPVPGVAEVGPYWRSVPDDVARTIRRFFRGVTPFPASRGWRH